MVSLTLGGMDHAHIWGFGGCRLSGFVAFFCATVVYHAPGTGHMDSCRWACNGSS